MVSTKELQNKVAYEQGQAKDWQETLRAKSDQQDGGHSKTRVRLAKKLDVDEAEAKTCLPEGISGCTLWHEVQTDRIRGMCRTQAGTITRSAAVAGDMHLACRRVLKWVWTIHMESTGSECPWPELLA